MIHLLKIAGTVGKNLLKTASWFFSQRNVSSYFLYCIMKHAADLRRIFVFQCRLIGPMQTAIYWFWIGWLTNKYKCIYVKRVFFHLQSHSGSRSFSVVSICFPDYRICKALCNLQRKHWVFQLCPQTCDNKMRGTTHSQWARQTL